MTLQKKNGIGKGVLDTVLWRGRVRPARYLPSRELSHLVEHLWTVSWDLRGQPPLEQFTLPYPSVHIVFERDNSRVVGVPVGRFARRLAGEGRVFGVKFYPGCFYPIYCRSVSELTGRELQLNALFELDVKALEAEVLAPLNESQMGERIEVFLRSLAPRADDSAQLARRIVERVEHDREMRRVADIAGAFGITSRSLQRLFKRTVGVSPKWVIQRFRLQDAVELLGSGSALNLAQLAADLGFADQAHFVREFRALVGVTPGVYMKRNLR